MAPQRGRRLYRLPDQRMVSGIAAGVAQHLGVRVAVVRATLVVLLPFNGVGALLYVALWAVLPIAPWAQPARRRNIIELLPYAALGAGMMLVEALSGLGGFSSALGWLIAV